MVRGPGLGTVLIAEIDGVFQRIEQGPERYAVVHGWLRRVLVRHFPYAVAVLHQRRDRKILDERLKLPSG